MNIKNFKFLVLIAIAGTLSLTGCKKTDDPINGQTQTEIESNLESSNWQITRFVDSGTDETYHFVGFTFTFGSDGVLTATNGSNSLQGTWSITDSNSNDDSQDDLDFNINFPVTNEFEDLNDDWDFVFQSDAKIELTDVSGGNGGTDFLTFEKL